MSIVREEQIIRVLRQYNPWWNRPAAIKDGLMPQKRLAFDEAMRMMRHKTLRRFVVLSGARRVGKTTILYQMIDQFIDDGIPPKNILYLSFDNPILQMCTVEELITIYESLYPIEGSYYLFFDEIQYTQNWELWLKVLYDTRKNIYLTATASASPLLEKGAADSGTGRWSIIKIPTLSFYEYCRLLQLEEPLVPENLKLTDLAKMSRSELGDMIQSFSHLTAHFNRYLMIGGFPELVLADDDRYAQRILREDVVEKVLKRDVLSLFNIRSPLLMEKLFVYLCMNSAEIFNVMTAAKELDNTTVSTIETYLSALEMSNLIYRANPMDVGSKGALKGRPKIYIADAAIRSAVLMVDDILSDEKELGITVETTVYKHILSFYQGTSAQIGYFRKVKENQKEVDVVVELPREKILCEVKYRNQSQLPSSDAIVELCNEEKTEVTHAFVVTRRLDDYGISRHETQVSILRIPALVFLYLLGKLKA